MVDLATANILRPRGAHKAGICKLAIELQRTSTDVSTWETRGGRVGKWGWIARFGHDNGRGCTANLPTTDGFLNRLWPPEVLRVDLYP